MFLVKHTNRALGINTRFQEIVQVVVYMLVLEAFSILGRSNSLHVKGLKRKRVESKVNNIHC